MEENFSEFDDTLQEIPDTSTDITNDSLDDEYDEPLDLGTPHETTDEEYEDFKESLNDNTEDTSDVQDIDQNDEIPNEEDEPLDLGTPYEMTDEEYEEFKNSLNNNDTKADADMKDNSTTDDFDDGGFRAGLRDLVDTGPHASDLEPDKPKDVSKDDDDDDPKIRVKGKSDLVR